MFLFSQAFVGVRPTLRTVSTHCLSCRQHTPERAVADRWIRHLPENQRFGGQLKIVRCTICGLMYLNPRPAPDALPSIYDFPVYADSTNRNPVLMAYFLRKLQTHAPRGFRVLEIGCSAGEFLAYLEGHGYECEGNPGFEEDGKPLVFKGKAHYGLMEGLELGEARYDAIFLLNTLEHVADPGVVMAKVHRLLKPGGVFLLRHPNAGMYLHPGYRYTVELAKLVLHLGLRAAGRSPSFGMLGFKNQHLFYFTARTVTRMLEREGFRVVEQSTADPYNALRAQTGGTIVDRTIARLRGVLGRYGLGPELLTVAQK